MYQPVTSQTALTRGGIALAIRPTHPDDGPRLRQLFDELTPEDLRFRFLASVAHVDADRIAPMLEPGSRSRATFLALDPEDAPVAVAMIAADDESGDAEVAISVRSDRKQQGIGWTMLEFVRRYAKQQGFRSLHSIESRDNRAAIDLERDAGFRFEPSEGDPSDVVARIPLSA
jgi:acetyltransferase